MLINQESEGEKIFESFTQAIAEAKHRPKGVLVSAELFNELHRRGLIRLELATPYGIPQLGTFGAVIPFFGDIYIHCDPVNLNKGNIHFRLPPEQN